MAYSELKEFRSAISDYTSYIRLNPYHRSINHLLAYVFRGEGYSSLGDYRSAISDFTSAIKLDPDYVDSYYYRGWAYFISLENRSAISDFTSAIRLEPDNANAYESRGMAKSASGLPYCSDYKKACDLGADRSCEWYYKQCR